METLTNIAARDPGRRSHFVARDGHPLVGRIFEPEGTARASVVVLGATAVPQAYYARFGAFLASSGVRALTFDYRGVGLSRERSLRASKATMSDWGKLDAPAALEHLRRRSDGEPILLVGHSFGGQALGLSDELHGVDGAVLVGSQLGWYGHWPVASRPRLAFLMHGLMPALSHAFGYLPGWAGLGTDLPKGVALEWARWCRHPEYLAGYEKDARARFAAFRAPILFFSFEDDDFAPRLAIDELRAALSSAPTVHHHLAPDQLSAPEIGHFGFFRQRFEPTLWATALDFVDDLARGERPREIRRWSPARRGLDVRIEADEILADLAFGRDRAPVSTR